MKTKQIQCYGCSLLCDDIYIEQDKGEVKTTINSCFRGNRFIRNYLSESRIQQPIHKQMGLEMFLSSEEATNLLKKEISESNSITFYGLGTIGYQEQVQVLTTIKSLLKAGKKVAIHDLESIMDNYLVSTRTTVGQAINNADLFIFWEVDPTHSHPKLFGKLIFSRGIYRLSGKEMKKFILIQKNESDLTRLKDILIDNSEQSSSQLVNGFLDLLAGKPLENITIGTLSVDNLRELKSFLQATEYGIILCSTPIKDQIQLDDLSQLIQKLNENVKGRFAFLPVTPKSNDCGLFNALTKIIGTQFDSLMPNNNPSNLAIVFGGEYLRDEFNPHNFEYPEKRMILFDNFKSPISNKAVITVPFAIPGIECNDTAVRMDGINVNLIKWNSPSEEIKTIRHIFKNL